MFMKCFGVFCISVLIGFLKRQNDIKERLVSSLIALVCSVVCVGIGYKLIAEQVTMWEFFYIASIASVIVAWLVIPIIKKQESLAQIVIKSVCLLAISTIFYSIMTYGQTYIYNDVATASMLAKCMIESHSLFPSSWAYANGEIWTLSSALLCVLPTWLISDQSLARMLTSVIFILLAVLALRYQSKKLFQDDSWAIAVPICFVLMSGVTQYMLYEVAYTGHVIWIALCPTLLFLAVKGNEKKRKLYGAIFFLIMATLCMSGIRYVAEQTLPLLITCFVVIYIQEKKEDKIRIDIVKEWMKPTVLTAMSTVIGYAIYHWLCTWHHTGDTVNNATVFVNYTSLLGDGIRDMLYSLLMNFGFVGGVNVFSLTGIMNCISIFLFTVVCLVVPILQIIKIKDESEGTQFFCIYALSHNFVMICMAVLLGKTETRYLTSTVIAFVMVFARFAYKYWLKGVEIRALAFVSVLTLITLVGCLGVGLRSRGWENEVAQKKEFNQVLINHGLKKGYSPSQELAYINNVYSDFQIQYGVIDVVEEHAYTPYWLIDINTYVPQKGIKSFLLLSEEDNESMGGYIEEMFGAPCDFFMNQGNYIYVYDHDIAVDFN